MDYFDSMVSKFEKKIKPKEFNKACAQEKEILLDCVIESECFKVTFFFWIQSKQ